MQTTSLTLSTNDTSPTSTTIWEALLGTGMYYLLPADTTVIEAVFSAVDEPLVKYVTFVGENIGDVVVKVTRKDGSATVTFPEEEPRFDDDGMEVISFILDETPGDKVEIIVSKENSSLPGKISGLNIAACYQPTEICPDDMQIKSFNITSNDMETGTVVVENPKETILDLPLYNPSGIVTFEVFVKPPSTPPAQFFTIELVVLDAASVKIMLKNNTGVTVKTLSDELLDNQERLFESFMGESGDYLVFEITADTNKNVTLKYLDIVACTEPSKDYCQLRNKTEILTINNCNSTTEVTYNFCRGFCHESSYAPLLFLNVNEPANSTKRYEKDCLCCTGIPLTLRSIPLICVEPNGQPYGAIGYIEDYDTCECHSCA